MFFGWLNRLFFISSKGRNNQILLPGRIGFGKVRIKIRGSNNQVVLGKGVKIGKKFVVKMHGEGCKVEIGAGSSLTDVNLRIGVLKHPEPAVDSAFVCGSGCGLRNLKASVLNSHTSIEIGDKCLFSEDVEIHNSDGHPIFDLESGKITNFPKNIKIGNHCWLGQGVSILKSVRLADETIVGKKAVVTKAFDEKFTAIGGNPAKVLKKGIRWEDDDGIAYFRNQSI